jgi:hypothetical protein
LEDLRTRADSGDVFARSWLTQVSGGGADDQELRLMAQNGDEGAKIVLIDFTKRLSEEDLRGRAKSGDPYAQSRLTDLLAERDDAEGLQRLAESGDPYARSRLVDLLVNRGDAASLRALAGPGDFSTQSRLNDLLVARRDEQGLRALADSGDHDAQSRLAYLLGKRAAVNELKELVHATFEDAARVLIRLYRRDRPDGGRVELDVNAEPQLIVQPSG